MVCPLRFIDAIPLFNHNTWAVSSQYDNGMITVVGALIKINVTVCNQHHLRDYNILVSLNLNEKTMLQ